MERVKWITPALEAESDVGWQARVKRQQKMNRRKCKEQRGGGDRLARGLRLRAPQQRASQGQSGRGIVAQPAAALGVSPDADAVLTTKQGGGGASENRAAASRAARLRWMAIWLPSITALKLMSTTSRHLFCSSTPSPAQTAELDGAQAGAGGGGGAGVHRAAGAQDELVVDLDRDAGVIDPHGRWLALQRVRQPAAQQPAAEGPRAGEGRSG